jgi:hypothetical protein
MSERLIGGDAVVLFPEGTSSDGIRILPFRSALIGAVHHAIGDSTHHDRVTVQPVSLAYVRFGACRSAVPCATRWRGMAMSISCRICSAYSRRVRSMSP